MESTGTDIPKQSLWRQQRGQAATEFIIVAAFVLVPLFLIVPLLGKYIDIKHAAIQHARFGAWEYTVWNGDNEKVMSGIKDSQSAGVRKFVKTEERGRKYFFGDRTAPDYGTHLAGSGIDPLWTDHRGTALLRTSSISGEIKENNTPVPFGKIGEITQTLFQFLGDVISYFGKLLRLLGTDAEFDAINTKGYYTSEVKVEVRSLGQILPRDPAPDDQGQRASHPLTFSAKAAVQSNNWNSGSRENATSESRGLVVTSLLSPISSPINKVLGGLNDLVGKIPLLRIKAPGMPEFGYVKDDLIPYEHIEGNKKKLQKKQGLYSYE